MERVARAGRQGRKKIPRACEVRCVYEGLYERETFSRGHSECMEFLLALGRIAPGAGAQGRGEGGAPAGHADRAHDHLHSAAAVHRAPARRGPTDDQLLALTRCTLEELGYKVLSARDGFEALEREEDHDGDIDLMLSDVVMPGLGGFELAGIIQDSRPDMKMVFMSGYPKSKSAADADIPERARFCQKPIGAVRLAQIVRGELDGLNQPALD